MKLHDVLLKAMASPLDSRKAEGWNESRWECPFRAPSQHRPLPEHLNLSAILCHVEPRVIGNDYTDAGATASHRRAHQKLAGPLPAQCFGVLHT